MKTIDRFSPRQKKKHTVLKLTYNEQSIRNKELNPKQETTIQINECVEAMVLLQWQLVHQ